MDRTLGHVVGALVAFAIIGAACSTATGRTTSPPASSTPATPTTVAAPPDTTSRDRFVADPPPAGTTLCERFTRVTETGRIGVSALSESSGVVASRNHDGVLWLHNDSGGDASVYAVDAGGAGLGTWALDGVFALDWEDIAIGPGPDPGVDYLYVGDIGDNLGFRRDVTVLRFPEPDPTTSGTVDDVVALRLGYPTPGIDAEAMLVDPIDGDLVIVTKVDDGRANVLRATATSVGTDPIIPMFEIATLDLGAGGFVTGADISPDGTSIALRGYEEVWMWPRVERDLATAFTDPPCMAPSPVERQGEALAFTADGDAFVTISEGTAPTVWRVGAET